MKRQEGYYWVKDFETGWMIAEWDGDEWWICGGEYGFKEEWDETGERIECPYK